MSSSALLISLLVRNDAARLVLTAASDWTAILLNISALFWFQIAQPTKMAKDSVASKTRPVTSVLHIVR